MTWRDKACLCIYGSWDSFEELLCRQSIHEDFTHTSRDLTQLQNVYIHTEILTRVISISSEIIACESKLNINRSYSFIKDKNNPSHISTTLKSVFTKVTYQFQTL